MFVNSAETLRDYHADPERRLRAVIIRRADEMGRAARALSGWLDVLRRRAAAAGITGGIAPGPDGRAREGQTAILVMRAHAWATALRRRLMMAAREDKAVTLWPDFAPVTDDLRTPGAKAAVETVVETGAVETGAAIVAAEPAETAGVVFLMPAKLDAALRAAEARAVRPPRPLAFDKVPAMRAPKPVRDARQRLEDKVAAEMIARLSIEESAERVFTYLGAAADRLEDKAAAAMVQSAAADTARRFAAFGALLKERAEAEEAAADAAAAAEAAAAEAEAAKAARWQRPVSLWAPAPKPRARSRAAESEPWPGPMLGGHPAPDTG